MAKILAVNSGSSSLKYQLLELPEGKVLASGYVERIGLVNPFDTLKFNGQKHKIELDIKNHTEAAKKVMENLIGYGILKSFNEVDGVGHRVVQGGKYFDDSAIVDEDVLAKVEELCVLAPLHNPAALEGYKAFHDALPNVGHVMVFDTSYHRSISEVNKVFPIPYEMTEKYSIARYGAHGTSHKFIAGELERITGKKGKFIVCHLGSGASVSAIKDGKCVNTSMGLTPLGGIMMGTRTGDMDPSVVLEIMDKEGLSVAETRTLLNKQSGLFGVSGFSDARDVEKGILEGNSKCKLAYDMYASRVASYIGSYFVELGGCDAIAFTAGLGERAPMMRKLIMERIGEALGIELDEEGNKVFGDEGRVSTENSKIGVYVVPTNEELAIAQDVCRLLHLGK